ncbi:MAG: hypothetical protein IPL91_16080 [Hyphomicrobium sp.]|nr:hypothetical protein [Hyphomicrobium sp.]
MTAHRSATPSNGLSAELAASVDTIAEAALLIDVDAASCLAANAPARLALGLAGAWKFPLALDSAMPAIASMRAYARQHPKPVAQAVHVTMWLANKPVTALCELSPLSGAAPTLVVVKLLDISGAIASTANAPAGEAPARPAPSQPSAICDPPDPAEIEPLPSSKPPPQAAATVPDEANQEPETLPPVQRDDAETLKEIARRIREGLPARREPQAAASPAPVLPDAGIAEASIQTGAAPQAAENATKPAAKAAPEPLNRDARARLAHELKTPLSAIVAASEIMRDERLGSMGNQQYLGYARDIHESASHALAVITKMLSRAASEMDEAGGTARVDLNDLAARTVSSMQALAAERDLTLDVDLEDGLVLVSADETAIRQILINLLANAFKFTPPGGDIRVVTGYQMNGSAFLVVRDTGDGMDQATMDEVFSNDGGRIGARRGGGYGIGLPLVRRLAQQIGADLEIDSAPLKGTVVLVSFPKHLLLAA